MTNGADVRLGACLTHISRGRAWLGAVRVDCALGTYLAGSHWRVHVQEPTHAVAAASTHCFVARGRSIDGGGVRRRAGDSAKATQTSPRFRGGFWLWDAGGVVCASAHVHDVGFSEDHGSVDYAGGWWQSLLAVWSEESRMIEEVTGSYIEERNAPADLTHN